MKVIYNSLLPVKGFTAINLFGVVFARREQGFLDDKLRYHEHIHSRQMRQCFAVGLCISLVCIFFLQWWWILVVPFFLFYILYLLEFFIYLLRFHDKRKAYRAISFEKQAYDLQDDWDKEFKDRHKMHIFSWFSYLRKY